MATRTNPLAIKKHVQGGETWFSVAFPANGIDAFSRALSNAWKPTLGYAIQALVEEILAEGSPQWPAELVFESTNDTFAVRCARRQPLVQLARRIERWIAYGGAPRATKVAQMGHAGDFPVYVTSTRMSS